MPFAFNCGNFSVQLLNNVDFLAAVRPPKIIIIRPVGDCALLGQFHKNKILPQRADVVSQRQSVKLRNNRIANAIIQKIIPGSKFKMALLDFGLREW